MGREALGRVLGPEQGTVKEIHAQAVLEVAYVCDVHCKDGQVNGRGFVESPGRRRGLIGPSVAGVGQL